jgi:hypothetical protein
VRKTDLKIILPSPSSWSDLTITKQRRDRRKLFHGGDIIFASMPSSENKSLYVVMSMKMLTPTLSPLSSTEPPWRFSVCQTVLKRSVRFCVPRCSFFHGKSLLQGVLRYAGANSLMLFVFAVCN